MKDKAMLGRSRGSGTVQDEAAIHSEERGADDARVSFTDRGPLPPVAPFAAAPASASDRAFGPVGEPLRAGPDGAAPRDEAKKPRASILPGGHHDKEVVLEFGGGSVTGELTATFEYGKSGVPLAGEQLSALKNSVAIELNGFVAKVETALLAGELDLGKMADGLQVSIEASALEVGLTAKRSTSTCCRSD